MDDSHMVSLDIYLVVINLEKRKLGGDPYLTSKLSLKGSTGSGDGARHFNQIRAFASSFLQGLNVCASAVE